MSTKKWEQTNPPLQTRVDPDTKEEVHAYARQSGCSTAKALRQLIEFGLETARSSESPESLQQPSVRNRMHRNS